MVNFAKWTTWLTLTILVLGIVFALPNLLTQEQADALPSWVPHNRINLGLDLQGGSHLLFEVDVDAVVRERLESAKDAVRDAWRKSNIAYTGLGVANGAVVAHLVDAAARDRAMSVVRDAGTGLTFQIDDAGNIQGAFSETELRDLRSHVVEQSREIVRRRVDEGGVKEPTILREGDNRIIVQLPGVGDPSHLEALIGKTAKMTFQYVSDQFREGSIVEPKALPPNTVAYPSKDGKFEVVETKVILSGENLVDAQAERDRTTNEPIVTFQFDSAGARKFARATAEENVGRRFAIVLDGEVITAPRINEPIPGGRGQITGYFTVDSAHDLALLLRSGALPAPLRVLEKRTVGAELGADSIATGKLASFMGLALVVVAVLICYGLFGVFTNIALMFNFILLVAAMSVGQFTLTLPGIAGMVLSLGIAVDANVLIHERIREEIRANRGPVMAIDAGYRAAFGTIFDSHLTTIISSAFLWIFGSGTVKGFAVTLILGTVISLFTAVVVTRLLIVTWLRRTRPQVLPI